MHEKHDDQTMKKILITTFLIFMTVPVLSTCGTMVSSPSDLGVLGGVCLFLATVVAWYYYVTRYLQKGRSQG
ncbi:MAG: hypothetical protein KGI50_00500 [Patescibacteria group bacterium]|nr:hypothetical protein [Patescibacteria group bacterium]MDE2438164.1 hypothetical protein [Patescibacteria group bacterium]